jgi:hypothetical protein
MYRIESQGFLGTKKRRIVADSRLTPADFDAIAKDIGQKPMAARKVSRIAACRTQERREVVTLWKGENTRNWAEPGDWIAVNLTPDGEVLRDEEKRENSYVITAATFDQLYERAPGEHAEFGPLFQAKGTVDTLTFAAGFDIAAPWGERQTGTSGYLLRNSKGEVYGNQQESFDSTYVFVD